jgi:hypothetical protein
MSNSYVCKKGDVYWHNEDGECHRLDGPALERVDGVREWYINGIQVFTLMPNGITYFANLDLPSAMKQSIIIEKLKVL